jgi:hypothetical protein
MPKNRTLYVTEEDAPIWDEAKRLVQFHERKSLSAYLTEHLRQYVENHSPRKGRKPNQHQS